MKLVRRIQWTKCYYRYIIITLLHISVVSYQNNLLERQHRKLTKWFSWLSSIRQWILFVLSLVRCLQRLSIPVANWVMYSSPGLHTCSLPVPHIRIPIEDTLLIHNLWKPPQFMDDVKTSP